MCRSEEPLAYQRRIRPKQKKTFQSWQNCRQGIENQTQLDVSMLS